MLKEVSFENSPYSLVYDEDTGVVLSKKNGVLWIDYSWNEVILQLLKKIKELEGELHPLREQKEVVKIQQTMQEK